MIDPEVTPAMIKAGADAIMANLGYLPQMSPGIAEDLARTVISNALAARLAQTVPLKKASRAQRIASAIVYVSQPAETLGHKLSRFIDCLYLSDTFVKLLIFRDKLNGR